MTSGVIDKTQLDALTHQALCPGSVVTDVLAVTRRNLLLALRNPEVIVFGVFQPIVLLMLFVFVFGGVIEIPGVSYVQFVVPAVLIQGCVFSSVGSSIGLAADLQKGMVQRFRSLPMTRSAVLTGRTLADAVLMILQMVVLSTVAVVIGFRFTGGIWGAIGAISLAVLVGFAMTWIMATIGMAVRSEQAAQAAGMSWLFPLVFLSSAYAPVETMPGWLQPIAGANPITAATNATRDLALSAEVTRDTGIILLWIVGIIVVFGSLSVRMYRRTA